MKTPVVLIIFNRPEETQKVFNAIRVARPETLLVIADGPRTDKNHSNEIELCNKTKAILEQVDWPCKVLKNYSERNIGCRARLSTGLKWVFEQVDRAIVFEADCLPDQSFFQFCEELLEKYKDDDEIMHISGNFFQHRNKKFSSKDSYYYSILPHIWGWATWRRAWKHYDSDIKSWPKVKASGELKSKLTDPAVYEYWETVWDGYYNHTVPSWDGQWTYACLMNNGISITPTSNLVTNIGFGPNAMQTKDVNSIFANIPLVPMKFPLTHPEKISVNKIADNFTWRQNFGINRKFRQRILGPIRRSFPKTYYLFKKLLKRSK